MKGWGCATIGLTVAVLLVACGWDGAGLAEELDAPTAGADSVILPLVAAPHGGGRAHLVRLVARGDEYAFEPAEIRVRPGDVVRFVHTGYQPESVAFDTSRVPTGGAAALAEQGALTPPLLMEPGAVYDIDFRGAPPGSYPFFSVPHEVFGMRGRVIVVPDSLN